MLAFTPKVRTLSIDLQWIIQLHPVNDEIFAECAGSDSRYKVENPDGVTVLDVVEFVRSALRDVEAELRSYL